MAEREEDLPNLELAELALQGSRSPIAQARGPDLLRILAREVLRCRRELAENEQSRRQRADAPLLDLID